MYLHQLRCEDIDYELIQACCCPRWCERIIEVLVESQDDSGLLEVRFHDLLLSMQSRLLVGNCGAWIRAKIPIRVMHPLFHVLMVREALDFYKHSIHIHTL